MKHIYNFTSICYTLNTFIRGKCGEMAVKLDTSKAYVRVEWECLQQTMRKLGFHEKWINIVMRCVFSVKYAIRINGQPCGQIQPSRGLRQGDPLSPYLFIICTEGLSTLLHCAANEKPLKVWLLQLEGLEYPTYFLSMTAWCLEEQQ